MGLVKITQENVNSLVGAVNNRAKKADVYTKAESDNALALKAPSSHAGSTGTAHGAATTSVNGFMSSTDKTKLDGVAAGAQVNTVSTVAGRTGAVVLTKADVGLGSVDNTADSSKSVASATTATRSANFDSTSHSGTFWLNHNWDGTYWNITSNHGAPARVGIADIATTATNATNATFQTSNVDGGSCLAVFQNTPAGTTSTRECNGWADAPNTGWWVINSIRHTNSANYWGTQIAYGWEDNANAIYQRNVSSGTWSAWTRVDVSSANITELVNNAGFATTTVATTTVDGLMIAADKAKLDGIAAGANAYALPVANAATFGGIKASVSGTTLTLNF
jgi:hypothetical protein